MFLCYTSSKSSCYFKKIVYRAVLFLSLHIAEVPKKDPTVRVDGDAITSLNLASWQAQAKIDGKSVKTFMKFTGDKITRELRRESNGGAVSMSDDPDFMMPDAH